MFRLRGRHHRARRSDALEPRCRHGESFRDGVSPGKYSCRFPHHEFRSPHCCALWSERGSVYLFPDVVLPGADRLGSRGPGAIKCRWLAAARGTLLVLRNRGRLRPREMGAKNRVRLNTRSSPGRNAALVAGFAGRPRKLPPPDFSGTTRQPAAAFSPGRLGIGAGIHIDHYLDI